MDNNPESKQENLDNKNEMNINKKFDEIYSSIKTRIIYEDKSWTSFHISSATVDYGPNNPEGKSFTIEKTSEKIATVYMLMRDRNWKYSLLTSWSLNKFKENKWRTSDEKVLKDLNDEEVKKILSNFEKRINEATQYESQKRSKILKELNDFAQNTESSSSDIILDKNLTQIS